MSRSVSDALSEKERLQYDADPAQFRQKRRGRAGTGAREVQAWWPEIERALRDGHNRKRIWEHLCELEPTDERPRLTCSYRQFNVHVSGLLQATQRPLEESLPRTAVKRHAAPQPSAPPPPPRPVPSSTPPPVGILERLTHRTSLSD